MAASTITRHDWIDDTGTPLSPVGDGTRVGNAQLQAIFNKIDQMFSGAGAYTVLTLGGRIAVEGFGDHAFSAGGTGANKIGVRNTTAGSTNIAQYLLGNDATPSAGALTATSSSFTPNGIYAQDATVVDGARPGGLVLGATHASGFIPIYAGGLTERARFQGDHFRLTNAHYLGWTDVGGTVRRVLTLHSDDHVYLDSPVAAKDLVVRLNPGTLTERLRLTHAGFLGLNIGSNAKMTQGLTISQGANDNEILALKSSDVAHGVTDLSETDTYGFFQKADFPNGGVRLAGLTESSIGIRLQAILGAEQTGKTASDEAACVLNVSTKSGTAYAGTAGNVNLLVIRNHDSGACTKFIFDSDGEGHADVSWTTFDVYKDTALLSALNTLAPRSNDVIRDSFGAMLEYRRDDLMRAGIVTEFRRDRFGKPHAMVNFTKLSMLQTGALVQQGARLDALEARLSALEAR